MSEPSADEDTDCKSTALVPIWKTLCLSHFGQKHLQNVMTRTLYHTVYRWCK